MELIVGFVVVVLVVVGHFPEFDCLQLGFLSFQNLKDINIVVTPRDVSGAMAVPRMTPSENNSDANESASPKKTRIQLEKMEGSFDYYTSDFEGSIEVCVQSYTATAESPSRVAFHVQPQTDEAVIAEILKQERALMNERLEVENRIIKDETSRITAELVRMQRRAKTISGDAQFSKQREEVFHSQSVALNQAVKYWPMIRMVVILIGGYLQVTHVVNYMKSRHIY
jgi:emp24/gp25L/p24 family/GOLD